MLCIAITSLSQNRPNTETPMAVQSITSEDINPFQQGNWNFDLNRIGRVNSQNAHYNGNKIAERNSLDISLRGTYFFANNIGVGLDLSASREKSGLTTQYTQSELLGILSLTAGTRISNNFNLYGTVGYGIGSEKYKQEIPGGNDQSESFDISRLQFAIGSPIRLGGTNVFLTPELGYSIRTIDYEIEEEQKSMFQVRLGLETYLRGSDIGCNPSHSAGMYNAGRSFIGYTTRASVGFGNYEFTYAGIPEPDKEDFNRLNVMFDYNRYVIDNFAVGIEAGIRRVAYEPENSGVNYKSSELSWRLKPQLTYNFPFFQNSFVQVGGGIGGSKYKEEYNNNTDEYKENMKMFDAYLGYNFFFARNLALTPMFGYLVECWKEDGADESVSYRGFDAALGVRFNF